MIIFSMLNSIKSLSLKKLSSYKSGRSTEADIMNFSKCIFSFVIIGFASGEKLIDPWRRERESCRKKVGLTREQLKDSKHHLEHAKNYYTCLARELGHLRKDGTIDVELEQQSLQLVIAPVISIPVTRCCNERVYKGRVPPKHAIVDYFIRYIECFKSLVTSEMFNAMGGLALPVYPRLEQCHKEDRTYWSA